MSPVAPRIVNDVSYVMRINDASHFSWQMQHLVILECHFSWQAQFLVKFWWIAGARKVVIFNTKCVAEGGKVSSANGRFQFYNFMLGSWSNRPRAVNNTSTVFGKFLLDFGMQFCVAGAVFGEVGGRCLLLRAL